MAEASVGLAIVGRNAAGRIIAEISQQIQGITTNAQKGGLAQVFTGFGVSARNAQGATRALETGLRGLAIQATGVSGAGGQLARALLLLGGGSGLVIGAAAGIGVVALAARFLGRDAKEAEERLKGLREEMVRMQVTPAGTALGLTGTAGEAVTSQQTVLARLATQRQRAVQGGVSGPAIAAFDKQIADATAELLSRQKLLMAAEENLAEVRKKSTNERLADLERERKALQEGALLAIRIQADLGLRGNLGPALGILGGQTQRDRMLAGLRPSVIGEDRRRSLAEAAGVGTLPTVFGFTNIANVVDELKKSGKEYRAAIQQTADATSMAAAQIVQSAGNLLIGLVQTIRSGGGIGGVIQGIGGLLGTIGLVAGTGGASLVLAGTGLGVAGGLISALSGPGRDKRPVDVRVNEFGPNAERILRTEQRRAQNVTPIIVIDARTNVRDFLAQLQRQVGLGAIPHMATGLG